MKSIVLFCLLVAVYSAPTPNHDDRIAKLKAEFTYRDCLLGVEIPPSCTAESIVYHWNHVTQKCHPVVYGGCHGTRNNFKSLEDCQKVAQEFCLGDSGFDSILTLPSSKFFTNVLY